MSLARLQHEVEELRRRIEELKVKLTAEMKVGLPLSLIYFLFFFYFLANKHWMQCLPAQLPFSGVVIQVVSLEKFKVALNSSTKYFKLYRKLCFDKLH